MWFSVIGGYCKRCILSVSLSSNFLELVENISSVTNIYKFLAFTTTTIKESVITVSNLSQKGKLLTGIFAKGI